MTVFSIPDNGNLERLKGLTKRSNLTEVVRDAIVVYRFLVDRTVFGHKIFVGPTRESAQEIKVSSLESLRTAGSSEE
jgi:hypothetical protein